MKAMIFSISAGCALFWGAIAWLISKNWGVAAVVTVVLFAFGAWCISLVCGQHR